MNTGFRISALGCGLALAMAVPLGGAAAQADEQQPGDETGGSLTLSGELALVSDYRFRGISLSDEDVAVQPRLTLSHESGLYLYAWGSNILETAGGADVELDLGAGYATELAGGVAIDAGVVWYLYPGDSAADYFEGYASVSLTRGAITPIVGVAYAPSQDALGNEDNFYVYGGFEAAIPDTDLTLSATLGYETGAFDAKEDGGKLDWQIGASYAIGPATLSISYVDTDTTLVGGGSGTRDLADAAVVAGVTVGF